MKLFLIFLKKSQLTLFILSLLLTFTLITCYFWVEIQTEDRVYSNINEIPAKKVALLLGTAKYSIYGGINLYFKYRIDAVVKLYKANKIQHIIASGDNRTKYYNEPIAMKKSLIERGIPVNAITLDYAGFRTLDSIVRCLKVFSQDDIIVVSQSFQNQRAIFISDYYGMKTIGFNAKPVPFALDMKTPIREYFARFKAVLDLYILKTAPKFLGDKVKIP
jgi:SanA protein